jgi:hypothetical protein
MRVLRLLLSAFVVLAASLSGASLNAADESYSFKPGAKVFLQVAVNAPSNWGLNSEVPLRLSFDEAVLKQAPFSVKKTVWDYKVDPHSTTYTAEIPIIVSKEATAGEITVPIQLACSICEETEGSCTFVSESVNVPINVETGSSAHKPMSKGKLTWQHSVAAP